MPRPTSNIKLSRLFTSSLIPRLSCFEGTGRTRQMREASRSFCGLPHPGDSASFNCPFLSLDKLVSQLPSVVLRGQVGSLHKPPHAMRGCLTPEAIFCTILVT